MRTMHQFLQPPCSGWATWVIICSLDLGWAHLFWTRISLLECLRDCGSHYLASHGRRVFSQRNIPLPVRREIFDPFSWSDSRVTLFPATPGARVTGKRAIIRTNGSEQVVPTVPDRNEPRGLPRRASPTRFPG
ncbi:hypothetical protein HOY80DRAFT_258514 [Tuber brumale]|nr:hypothetical protein HOY80DRAFT_258514 [Tuber brumale]